MSFEQSRQEMDQHAESLRNVDKESGIAPKERMLNPAALRNLHAKNVKADEIGSFNRSIVQGEMDFVPPWDEKELAEKNQGDRFNFNTGEAAAIKNEAVSGYVDIYSSPATIVEIPLKKEIDESVRGHYELILAEEFTVMDREKDCSFPTFLQLCDLYVTHGVAIGYFEDKQTMNYKAGGLDTFKFPRNTSIITSDITFCSCTTTMSVIDLYRKIGGDEPMKNWNREAVIEAITNAAKAVNNKWDNWEVIQQHLKSNDVEFENDVDYIELVYGWVVEFDKSVSFYITTASGADTNGHGTRDDFLFKEVGYYKNVNEAFQIFSFTVGNKSRIHSVRGLGYLIYQICNAMNVLTCKMMDNARIEGSMMFQAGTAEDLEDLELVDFGGGIALPPSLSIPARPQGANLNNSMIPALQVGKSLLDRATGGLSAGNMMLGQQQDRRTKLEVSAQLDFINKLNSFAINLFYGPLDNLIKEKVKRAFTVKQQDKISRDMVEEMKMRCIARGVPEEVFEAIDFKKVKAMRIIGTGSRVSRVMIYDQLQQMFSSMDDIGRKNFVLDRAAELIGADKAVRYFGAAGDKRMPIDAKIAEIENIQMLEGSTIAPLDGEIHMVHIPRHIDIIEENLQGVEEGQVDLVEFAIKFAPIHEHLVNTIEMTTVPEELEAQYSSYVQRVQQIGEIIVNGLRKHNKEQQKLQEEQAAAGAQGGDPQAQEGQEMAYNAKLKEMETRQKMQMQAELHQEKLRQLKEMGQQKIVLEAQKAMSNIALKDAEINAKLARIKSLES